MGGVAVLHPQPYLNDNLLHTQMNTRQTVKFSSNFTNNPSRTPSFTVPDSRRRPPMKGILNKNDGNTEAVATESLAATVSKNLVSGSVKILKRGEVLNESSTILKELNNRNLSNDGASTPKNDLVTDKDTHKVWITGRRALPPKKKVDKETKMLLNSKIKDISISSRHRPECFAGSAFTDSPPPSSLPLPAFFRKDTMAAYDATTDLRRILGLSVC